ncbi:MAG TPA: trypsin-like peptidase domain-containing protein [Acetobacteraceae bacterium]|nr:trypsin-like peptidase domain-containing protein [Acetobacteraceae bacterium]
MSPRLPRIALVWVLVLLTAWVLEPYAMVAWMAARTPRVVTPRGSLSALEQSTIDLFHEVSPSVVHVYASGQQGLAGGGRRVLQTGSGVVWDAAGDIVTNHHVIRGQTALGVRLTSGELVRARIVGVAPNYDLAVLRLERPRAVLRPITVGSSKDLQVGQTVFAIGNPYGLDQTLTNGIISALHRRLPESPTVEIADVIQTDAPINPGNSGGPLIDSAGRMIGLNTAILSESGASAGIGFAIPVDTVNRVAAELIKTGSAPVPGVGIVTAGPAASAQVGIDGVIVLRTMPGSPAAAAGLQGVDVQSGTIGDVITAVDGKPVHTTADLSALLADVGIGNSATLTVERDSDSRTMKVAVIDIAPGGRGQ